MVPNLLEIACLGHVSFRPVRIWLENVATKYRQSYIQRVYMHRIEAATTSDTFAISDKSAALIGRCEARAGDRYRIYTFTVRGNKSWWRYLQLNKEYCTKYFRTSVDDRNFGDKFITQGTHSRHSLKHCCF